MGARVCWSRSWWARARQARRAAAPDRRRPRGGSGHAEPGGHVRGRCCRRTCAPRAGTQIPDYWTPGGRLPRRERVRRRGLGGARLGVRHPDLGLDHGGADAGARRLALGDPVPGAAAARRRRSGCSRRSRSTSRPAPGRRTCATCWTGSASTRWSSGTTSTRTSRSSTPSTLVALALARSPGIERVATFGELDFGPAIEVFEVQNAFGGSPAGSLPFDVRDVADTVTVASSVEDAIVAVGAGRVGDDQAMVVRGDTEWDEPADIQGDQYRRRERAFGRVHQAESNVMTSERSATAVAGRCRTIPARRARSLSWRGTPASPGSRPPARPGTPTSSGRCGRSRRRGRPWTGTGRPSGDRRRSRRRRASGSTSTSGPSACWARCGSWSRALRWACSRSRHGESRPEARSWRSRPTRPPARPSSTSAAYAPIVCGSRWPAVGDAERAGRSRGGRDRRRAPGRTLVVPPVPLVDRPDFVFGAVPESRACVPTLLGPDCDLSQQRPSEESTGIDRTFVVPRTGEWRVSGARGRAQPPRHPRAAAPAAGRPGDRQLLAGRGPDGLARGWSHDRDPTTSWIADPRDREPTLTVELPERRVAAPDRGDRPCRHRRPPDDATVSAHGEERVVDLTGSGVFEPLAGARLHDHVRPTDEDVFTLGDRRPPAPVGPAPGAAGRRRPDRRDLRLRADAGGRRGRAPHPGQRVGSAR